MWTAIHAVGAAAERRVWTPLGINKLHPNLFVFLVGPPGTGKSQALNPMSVLLRKSNAVELAPNDITKQGFLDALAKCPKGALLNGRPFDYHFMAICISEMSNFMSKYDLDLAGIMTDLFDCPPMNDEKKRSGAGTAIPFPGISMIVGTATANLGSTITDELWGSGFMARVIMVYSADEVIPANMFAENPVDDKLAEELVTGLRRIGEMKGPMEWTPEAQHRLLHFRLNQKDGAPLHNRLAFYVTRRWLHLGKLCMISALSDERMVVEESDFAQATEWLFAAEREMPEIFKDMVHHEDGVIFEEMRLQMFGLHMASGRKPIPASMLYEFLSKRVSAYGIPRMIEVAVASGYFRRMAGTSGEDALYIPSPPLGFKDSGIL